MSSLENDVLCVRRDNGDSLFHSDVKHTLEDMEVTIQNGTRVDSISKKSNR